MLILHTLQIMYLILITIHVEKQKVFHTSEAPNQSLPNYNLFPPHEGNTYLDFYDNHFVAFVYNFTT